MTETTGTDAGLDGAQDADGEVPGGEAQGRGPQAQEEQVGQQLGPGQACQVPAEAGQRQGGQHEEQAPAEDAARHLQGVVAVVAYLAGQDGVECPGQGRQQGQDIAQRIEPEHGVAVDGNADDAGHGADEAHEKAGVQALAQDDAGQQGREEGRDAHQHAHVGRRTVAQGDVFQQKVEGHAAQARQGKDHFPAPVTHMQQARAGQQQGTGPQQKAQEKDLDGRKGLQQHLGGGEGGAPDEDGQDGGRVGGKGGIHGAASLGRRARCAVARSGQGRSRPAGRK